MKAVWFRFLGADGKPTAWHGLAVGKDQKELFWAIDYFGDPYSCEIIAVKRSAAICFHIVNNDPENEEPEVSDIEVSEGLDLDGKWKKPVWPENPYK